MHETRKQIIGLLKEKGEATISDLVANIELTHMAVRYHLNVLQASKLVKSTRIRYQDGPGRPQQIYKLTEDADSLFPEDYIGLADYIINQLNHHLDRAAVIEIFNGIADRIVAEAPTLDENQPFESRLDELIIFLGKKGFSLDWDDEDENFYMVHVHSCPYRKVAKIHADICMLDKKVIGQMLNASPVRVACLVMSDNRCTYQILKPTC